MDASSSWNRPPAPGQPAAPGYREVGETLLVAEAAFLSVGIPWLLPTNAVRKRAQRALTLTDEPSTEAFFRVSLVNISTPTLEAYLEDLGALPSNQHGAKALGLSGISFLERCALPVAVFAGSFLLVYIGSLLAHLDSVLASGFAGVGAFMSCLLTLPSCLEPSRRRSFQWHLNEELLRRRGVVDAGPSTVIPLRIEPVPGAD